jgi:hypothetical protein
METEGGKRIERVEIFSHNDNVIFFRFYENNKEVIGLARCQSYKTFFLFVTNSAVRVCSCFRLV